VQHGCLQEKEDQSACEREGKEGGLVHLEGQPKKGNQSSEGFLRERGVVGGGVGRFGACQETHARKSWDT